MNINPNRISLDGTWRFRLDPKEEGEGLGWQKLAADFPIEIQVPGSWQSQGIGHSTRADARRTLATTMRVLETVATRPEGRYLFDALLRYAASPAFKPTAAVTVEQFDALRLPTAFINE